ncbi:MAG: hypothetical protein ACLFV6_17430 [Spirulinaceae cyanobacterium]
METREIATYYYMAQKVVLCGLNVGPCFHLPLNFVITGVFTSTSTDKKALGAIAIALDRFYLPGFYPTVELLLL